MRLCNDVITVFNAQFDATTDKDIYTGTIIRNVSWYGDVEANVVESGLKAANKVVVRIPEDADFGDKSYVDPLAYKTSDPAKTFTLANGDIIVKGAISGAGMTPSVLQKQYVDCVTILGVTDNRRAPNAPHWRVVSA